MPEMLSASEDYFEFGLGVEVRHNQLGYSIVKVDNKVVKRFSNSRETSYQDADRYASDLFFARRTAQAK